MMMCKEVVQMMPLHAGSDLPAEQQDAVSAHLSHCLSCYREHRRYADALQALACVRQSSTMLVSLDGLPESVLQHVHADDVPVAIEGTLSRWTFLVPIAAAAAILVLMVGTSFLSPRGRQSTVPSVIAAPLVQPMNDAQTPLIDGTPVNFHPRRIWDGRRVVNRPPGGRDF
jgi:hypothetical protein